MNFITGHITCRLPSKSENIELHELVNNYQNHKCGKYCKKAIKSKKGNRFYRVCRFGFPRIETTKFILHDVVDSIVGRKSSMLKKRLYNLPRNDKEVMINEYNPILLILWRGNMDIQFISEESYALNDYITKYVTKADKSHISNDDFGIDESIQSRLWKFAYRALKKREIGGYEVVDRWFVDNLYKCSETFQFVPTVFPQNRTRLMKNLKDLEKQEKDNPESTDIFQKDMLSTYYPYRPDDKEDMSLKEYASEYERGYKVPKKTELSKSWLTLKGENNGMMRPRLKKALIYHHEFDPHVDPEKYYFSLLLLFKPWRKEEELKGECTSYKEAFLQNKTAFPMLQEYDQIKQKIRKSKKKIEDEVSKKIAKIDEKCEDSEPENEDLDDE